MPALWTKISLGAVGVFATGMMGITVYHQAADGVEHAVAHAVSSAVHEATHSVRHELAFRLNGEELGRFRRFSVSRVARGDLPEVALEVELHQLAALKALARCDLTMESGGPTGDIQVEGGFRCAEPAERPLVGMGTIRFTPGGVVRPILVSKRHESELRRGEPFEAAGTLDGPIQVSARDGDGAMVKIRADSSGANIRVNDEFGRALVRLFADSTGTTLRVRDEDGREVVRLDASEGGFSLTVDTSGVE